MDSGSQGVYAQVVVTSLEPVEATAEPTLDRRPSTSAGVQATLAVLDLLAARSPLSLSEISRELGIAKSTLHRVCAVLVDRGWAVRDGDGRFSLGIRALRLGSSSSELPIVIAFKTVAAEFLTRQDETIALAILDGVESLFVAMEETSQPVRLGDPRRVEDAGVRLGERARGARVPPTCGGRGDVRREAARHAHRQAAERRGRARDDPRRGARASATPRTGRRRQRGCTRRR